MAVTIAPVVDVATGNVIDLIQQFAGFTIKEAQEFRPLYHVLHIGSLVDIRTIIGRRAAYYSPFAVNAAVGGPHDDFGLAVLVPVKSRYIGFYMSAAQQVGSDVDDPHQTAVLFVGFEIAESAVVGYRKVAVDAFDYDFVLSVPIQIGSGGVVQFVKRTVVDAVLDNFAHRNFQVLFIPDQAIGRFRAFDTLFDQADGITRSTTASLVEEIRNAQGFSVQFDTVSV